VTSPRVLWLGVLDGPSGYADEARGFLRALEATGAEPAARALIAGDRMPLGEDDQRMLDEQRRRSGEGAGVAVHHYAPVWAPQAPTLAAPATVARTMFETDRVPRAWLPQLLTRDEIWVPSHAGAEAFERGGIPASRLRVIGGTLDFDLYRPGIEPLDIGTPEGHLVFLSNFDFSERKAWRQLLAAWARAFDASDPVTLVLKTGTGEPGKVRARVAEEARAAARAAGRIATAPVRVLTDTLAPADLARLYAAADAYVLPSRGEGWGRPYMEAMAMGLPTVASRFLGNLEFMDDEHSWLVGGEVVDVPRDHAVFADDVTGHRWFEPDVTELSDVLTEIAGDPAAARAKASGARAGLVERFGPDATARALRDAIAEAAERHRALERSGRRVVMRGPFGRHASLGLVNDRLLAGLEAGGRRVEARLTHAPPAPVEDTSVSHSWPPDFSAGALGRSVVILPWEYGNPPQEWVDRVPREVDRVVVYSGYVRDCYLAAGMPPGAVEVVPCGVDLDVFTPEGPARDLGRGAGCVFLFVGGTIWRKGVDLLLQAWERAFGPDDDVLLVIKDFGGDSYYRGQTKGDLIRATAERDDVAPILHLTEHLEPAELPPLYRSADVLVAPYRGEGFCLPILEAMACGVPAIHTAIGPSSEFAGDDAGWAVAASRTGVGNASLGTLSGPGYVHEVDVDAFAAALREAAASPAERERRGAVGIDRARGYSWDAAAARMDEVLRDLEREGLPPVREVAAERPEGRSTLVAYAPDWDDEPTWSSVLARWAGAVGPDDDVTLVLCVDEPRAGDVAAKVMDVLDALGDGVPDLALHARPDTDPLPLVLGADAVLLDDRQAADPPPALHRRAARLLTLGELHEAFKTPAAVPTTRV
jgi:glycosyltransferase involved in cell wall biosynthesis